MTTDAPRSDSPPEPYYGFRFPETDGEVTMMDRVSPYPPEFIEFMDHQRQFVDRWRDRGMTADWILSCFSSHHRPIIARYLVQQGEVLRSEFRSETEAEAFWAHVGEDAAIERANLREHGMAQVPDPSE